MSALLADLPPTIDAATEQMLLSMGRTDDIVLATLAPAFHYMKRISRGRLPDDELLSDAYSALQKAIRNFKPGQQRFLSYSRAYCRGELAAAWRSKDCVRSAAAHETSLKDDKFPEPLESDSVEPDIDDYWAEVWQKIEPLIRSKLSAKALTVLELHYREGLTFREVGERMGLSRERIRQIEQTALKKIRRFLPKNL